jgi:4-hydroxybenzoate polyprenyltransferase
MIAPTYRPVRLLETVARIVAAAFGGVSIAIACLVLTAGWRGETGEIPPWYGFAYGTLMALLGLACAIVAVWPPRESSRRAKAMMLGVGVVAGAVFVVALFHGALGGPPEG